MTKEEFKSLSIGDSVVQDFGLGLLGPAERKVTNQFIRVLEGQPTSFIHLSDASGNPLIVAEYRAYQYASI